MSADHPADPAVSSYVTIPSEPLGNLATGRNPSMQDWPGDLNFRIKFKEAERARDPQVKFLVVCTFFFSINI
jgi:hypothetical protein